jgi:hypothetical protein
MTRRWTKSEKLAYHDPFHEPQAKHISPQAKHISPRCRLLPRLRRDQSPRQDTIANISLKLTVDRRWRYSLCNTMSLMAIPQYEVHSNRSPQA